MGNDNYVLGRKECEVYGAAMSKRIRKVFWMQGRYLSEDDLQDMVQDCFLRLVLRMSRGLERPYWLNNYAKALALKYACQCLRNQRRREKAGVGRCRTTKVQSIVNNFGTDAKDWYSNGTRRTHDRFEWTHHGPMHWSSTGELPAPGGAVDPEWAVDFRRALAMPERKAARALGVTREALRYNVG